MQEEPEKGVLMAIVTVRQTVPSLGFGIHTHQSESRREGSVHLYSLPCRAAWIEKGHWEDRTSALGSLQIYGEQCF